MNMFGMTWEQNFALLLTAMGPVGITMSYMPIARALPPAVQRQLAWRTVLVGFSVAVGLMLLGGGVVRRFHLGMAVLVMAGRGAYFVPAVPLTLAEAERAVSPAARERPRRSRASSPALAAQ